MKTDIRSQIDNIVTIISKYVNKDNKPQIGMILGSGLGDIIQNVKNPIIIPYKDIPGVPVSTAPGHAGNLVFGELYGKQLVIMQGRLHTYEGHSPQESTVLIRAIQKIGVKTLIITCAAGGLNHQFNQGDLMLLTDHINFSGVNPLVGANLDEFGPRFPGMFDIYTPKLQAIAIKSALKLGITLQKGIYAGILGPAYATRAELQFYINNNCDAIGMSVIGEAFVAAHGNMQILALAAITDMALPYAVSHANGNEVVEAGKQISSKLTSLIKEVLPQI